MGGQQVKQLAHKLFSCSQNPHLSAVYLMYHSYDFFKNKTNSLAAFGNSFCSCIKFPDVV